MRLDVAILGAVMVAGSVGAMLAPMGPHGAAYSDAYTCVELTAPGAYGEGAMGPLMDALAGPLGRDMEAAMQWCRTAPYIAYALDAAAITGAAVAIMGAVLNRRPKAAPEGGA